MIKKLRHLWALTNSKRLVYYLKSQGVSIRGDVFFRSPLTTRIDLTRPTLVSFGDNVDINKNFQLLTHDYGSFVFRNKFCDFLNSSGAVSIGSNIYFGTNVTVLKGVSIGDNCIIAACSVVNKSIPANSVAAGVPCKVICSIEEYYNKRKQKSLGEAVEYVNSIFERLNRAPYIHELYEEFVWFVDGSNYDKYSGLLPLDKQLGIAKYHYIQTHKAPFDGYEDFINYCKKQE